MGFDAEKLDCLPLAKKIVRLRGKALASLLQHQPKDVTLLLIESDTS